MAFGLLLIGGLLVIEQQLNIGQFVAAEIIILLVILRLTFYGAFFIPVMNKGKI